MTSCTRGLLLLFITLCILCCFLAEQIEQKEPKARQEQTEQIGKKEQRRQEQETQRERQDQKGHLRQKRGLVKMMMHVMWDPVRLIRYWYAYDVTKEIAKSWRKIIPTMVLHPFLGDTPGIAKYLNPTYGLVRTNKKQTGQFKYPDGHTDEGEYLQSLVEQSEPSKNTYANSGMQFNSGYLQALPEESESPKNTHTNPGMQSSSGYLSEQFESSRIPGTSYGVLQSASSSIDSAPVLYRQKFKIGNYHEHFPVSVRYEETEGHKDGHVYFHPVVHQEFKRDNRDRSPEGGQSPISDSGQKFFAVPQGSIPMPFPYQIGIPSSGEEQQIVLKAVPNFHSSAEFVDDHAASSSSDHARIRNVHLGSVPGSFVSRHPGFVDIRQNSKPNSESQGSSEDGRQEIHIVLHPIPVGETNKHSYKGPGREAMHFVPYNFNTNASSMANHFSFALPTVAQETSSSHEEQSSSPTELQTKSDLNENRSENKNESTSAELYDTNQTSRVTWVLKRKKSSNKRKDPKFPDTETYAEMHTASVFDKNATDDSDHKSQHPLRIKGHRIDIDQLREDLKHGTPVLIPFNRKVKFAPNSNSGDPAGSGHLNIRGEIQYGASSKLPQESFKKEKNRTEDIIKVPPYSSEEYNANNTTQRLLLFLTKMHSADFHK